MKRIRNADIIPQIKKTKIINKKTICSTLCGILGVLTIYTAKC
jgi:hypothetical protein